MAAPDSKAERIVEAIRLSLQGIKAASGYWYTPDRVGRIQEFRDHWFKDSSFQTLYFLTPGRELQTEQPTKQIKFQMDLTVICLRKYPWDAEDPLAPAQEIVASATYANGALTIAQQPLEPSPLMVLVTDADSSLSAGLLTLTGTDPEGAALVATVNLATDGRIWTPQGEFKTLTSAVISGMAGGTAADTVRILAGVQRWTQQNRLVRDAIKAIGTAGQLSALLGNDSGVENVEIVDIDRNTKGPFGWSLAFVHLTVTYYADRTSP